MSVGWDRGGDERTAFAVVGVDTNGTAVVDAHGQEEGVVTPAAQVETEGHSEFTAQAIGRAWCTGAREEA